MTTDDVDEVFKGSTKRLAMPFEQAGEPFFIALASVNVTDEARSAGISYSMTINTVYDCLGDCNRHGQCTNGTCTCAEGFTGDDCNLRVSEFAVPKLPSRPMLLVPGLGSSRLDATPCEGKNKEATQVWVDSGPVAGPSFMVDMMSGEAVLPIHEDKIKRYLIGDLEPSTGSVTPSVCKDSIVDLDPTEAGVRGISELLSDKAYGAIKAMNVSMAKNKMPIDMEKVLQKVTHMKPLVDCMVRAGYVEGDTLFGFPWDWRGSVRSKTTVQALREKVLAMAKAVGEDESLTEKNPNDDRSAIDIVSHGEGGLVVLAYIAEYPEEADLYIQNWISLGAPFKGTAGAAVGHFIYGKDFNNPYMSPGTGLALLAGMPSMYETLPNAIDYPEDGPSRPHIKWAVNDSPEPKGNSIVEKMVDSIAPGVGEALEAVHDAMDGKIVPKDIHTQEMSLVKFATGGKLKRSMQDIRMMVRTSAREYKHHGREETEADTILSRSWSDDAWQYAQGTWQTWENIEKPRLWHTLRLHAIAGDTQKLSTPGSLTFKTPVRNLRELRNQVTYHWILRQKRPFEV